MDYRRGHPLWMTAASERDQVGTMSLAWAPVDLGADMRHRSV